MSARYPGESWHHEMIRASLADAEREAESARRSAAMTPTARKPPAASATRPAVASKPAPAPDHPPAPSQHRWAWHGGDHPNDFRMTPEENDQ